MRTISYQLSAISYQLLAEALVFSHCTMVLTPIHINSGCTPDDIEETASALVPTENNIVGTKALAVS